MTKIANKSMTKAEQVIKLLRRVNGASMEELVKATSWQQHSVRGFLSGTIRKKFGYELSNEPDRHGVRRYRIVEQAAGVGQ